MISPVAGSNTLNINQTQQEKEEQDEQLASGLRINSASDDPAGLQIANRLTAEINESSQRAINAQDQINANDVASSSLAAANDELQRARELILQAGNPLVDPRAIQGELDQITDQVNTIANQSFGTDELVPSLNASDPAASLQAIDQALAVTGQQATALGASSNALGSQVNTYQISAVNQAASRSAIQDTDFAAAVSEQQQAGTQLQVAIRLQREEQENRGTMFDETV